MRLTYVGYVMNDSTIYAIGIALLAVGLLGFFVILFKIAGA